MKLQSNKISELYMCVCAMCILLAYGILFTYLLEYTGALLSGSHQIMGPNDESLAPWTRVDGSPFGSSEGHK